MSIQVTGKQMDIGESLRTHVESKLSEVTGKYFSNLLESHVFFGKERHEIKADLSVHVGRGVLVQAHDHANDAYAAFDSALDKVAKQLKKYKEKMKDQHSRMQAAEEMRAKKYIFSGEEVRESESSESEPAIIAEMATKIAKMSVAEAVRRMEFSGSQVLVFRNATHGGINVVYRRYDGNISWIDPEGFEKVNGSGKH